VFEEKDSSKVEEFLKFLKEQVPSAKVSVVKDKLGFSSVSITQIGGGKPVEEVEEVEEVVVEEPVKTLDATAACWFGDSGSC
jgi:hypothetical protein